VALFAGNRKLHEWQRPPYAVDLSAAMLKGAEVRARLGHRRDRLRSRRPPLPQRHAYSEEIDVDVVELPSA